MVGGFRFGAFPAVCFGLFCDFVCLALRLLCCLLLLRIWVWLVCLLNCLFGCLLVLFTLFVGLVVLLGSVCF